MDGVTQRVEALVERLTTAGWSTQDPVRVALREVPRHMFAPSSAWTGEGDPVSEQADPEAWLDPGFGSTHEVRLVVMPDGTAVGRFTGYASYMTMRAQRHPVWAASARPGRRSTTDIDPRTIGYAPAGADLAMGVALPGVRARGERDGDGYILRLWSPDAWATAHYEPGRASYEVEQSGDRALWDLATSAYFDWITHHSPGRDRFGLTVTPTGDHVWLDRPDDMCPGRPV